MLSFRQKLDMSYLLVFGLCLALLFPLSSRVVGGLVRRSLDDKTAQVLRVVSDASDLKNLVATMKRQPPLLHRITIFRTGGELVYDSERARFGPMVPPQIYLAHHPEVTQAFEKGVGFGQYYSETLKQELVYLARRVDEFHGDTLVLRTAFPVSEVEALTRYFKLGFMVIGVGLLLVFMLIVALVGYHLSAPIRRMVEKLRPYHEGRVEQMPVIEMPGLSHRDEICRLADTINFLNARLEKQITTLTHERNERETLLSYLSEGVIVVDESLYITYVNRKALTLLDCSAEALLGVHLREPSLKELVERCCEQEELLRATVHLCEECTIEATAVPKGIQQGAVLILQERCERPTLAILHDYPHSQRVAQIANTLRANAVQSVVTKY